MEKLEVVQAQEAVIIIIDGIEFAGPTCCYM
jgi:hypothetical protein